MKTMLQRLGLLAIGEVSDYYKEQGKMISNDLVNMLDSNAVKLLDHLEERELDKLPYRRLRTLFLSSLVELLSNVEDSIGFNYDSEEFDELSVILIDAIKTIYQEAWLRSEERNWLNSGKGSDSLTDFYRSRKQTRSYYVEV